MKGVTLLRTLAAKVARAEVIEAGGAVRVEVDQVAADQVAAEW